MINNLLRHDTQNTAIQNALKKSIVDAFPIESGDKKLTLSNIRIPDTLESWDFPKQKTFKLERKSWQVPIYADIKITDAAGSRIISQKKNTKIGNIPVLTNRFTTIIDGNEYQTVNQLRRKSGIYSHIKQNGELESEFNLAQGFNFKMQLIPETQLFVLILGNRKYRLWTLLNVLGMDSVAIEKAWSKPLLEINQKGALNTEVSEMTSIFKKVYNREPKDYKEVLEKLNEYFNVYTQVDPETTRFTLGESFEHVTAPALLSASKKLLAINKGTSEPDERDNLIFKKLYSVEDLLSAHFEKQIPIITRKLARSLSLKDQAGEIISSSTFGKSIKEFFTTGDLSATPPQTNPVTIVEEWRRTSPMGTGGIQSRHSITMESRNLQPTHLGYLDSLATPECLDKKTEVFTKKGWIFAPDITLDTEIACNIKGSLEFHKPHKVFKHEYTEQMFGYKNSRLNYLVSAGHNIWAKNYYSETDTYALLPITECYGKKMRHELSCDPYEGNNVSYFRLPGTDVDIDINDWAEFIGWFLSEGCVIHYSAGHTAVSLTQVKSINPQKWQELSSLLLKLPFDFNHYEHYFYDKKTTELHRYLENFGEYANNKHLLDYYLDLPKNARLRLAKGLMAGDGRRQDPRSISTKVLPFKQDVYTTSSKQLALDVERLLIGLGFAVTVNIYKDARAERYHDIFEVRILGFSEAVATPENYYMVKSDGHVFSARVPGNKLLIKRESSWAHWTGNSGRVGITVGLASEVEKDHNDMTTPVYTPEGKLKHLKPLEFFNAKIGFPDQYSFEGAAIKPNKGKIKVMYQGELIETSAKDVDYYLRSAKSMFSFASNLVPFLANTQGNRASTGSRMITQAMSLVDREIPLVQSRRIDGETYEDLLGNYLNPVLGVSNDGKPYKTAKITKIADDYIYLETPSGEKLKRGLYKDFPLNQDGFLNSSTMVNVGDTVTTYQPLAENNYSRGKTLALGKNLVVAYMPYKGYNFEDGAVITESAAKKLSHQMIHKSNIFFSPKLTNFNLKKFTAWYPEALKQENILKLTEEGLPKIGETFQPGEYLAAYLVEKEMDETDRALKKLDKHTFSQHAKKLVEWDEDEPGEVIDVKKVGRNIDIYIKAVHPFKEGDKLCVDENTEILTRDGWKFLLDISIDDNFCTLNAQTHDIEYQNAEKINIYDHDGPLYQIQNTLIDQLVTLDHKMYVKLRYQNNYELLKASDIKGKRVRYLKNGLWKGNTGIVPKPFVKQMDDLEYAALMGWYLSEGNTNKTSNGYVTTIHQSKKIYPNNYEEIAQLIKNCGFTPIYRPDRLVFNGKEFHQYLKQFGHAHEKFIPVNIKNASSEIILTFLDAYNKGDGHTTNTGQSVITTNSIQMRDGLMELWLKAGYSASYKLSAKKGDTICGNPVNYDIWNVRQIRTKNSPQVNHGHIHEQNAQIEQIIHYQGKVGCPTTPNGIIYIRRNGKTSWTGNSGRYGNKSIVTKIIPDDYAPHREDGTPVEIMLNPHGVPSRMNIGQILETAAGKIAVKTGKPYIVNNFENPDEDAANKISKELKKLNIEADEKLTDGHTGMAFDNKIFVGNQYFLKLRHIVKKKQGVHNYGSYDVNELPVGKGAQKTGTMETYAYLAHGAKANLAEMSTVKGRSNEEYWRNLQLGLPPVPSNKNFIFDKLLAHLKGAGINIDKQGSRLRIFPLTDKETIKMSNGEIKDPGAFLIGKNLMTRKGGLFDPEITGGLNGTHWSHINLTVPVPNPMFSDAIMKVLDLTEDQLNSTIRGSYNINGKTGVPALLAALKDINVKESIIQLKTELKNSPPTNVNKLNRRIRYLQTLDELKLTPIEAYIMKTVPVLPPAFRPIYPLQTGDLMISDLNKHYRDIGTINIALKGAKNDLNPEELAEATASLYTSIKAFQGFIDPINYSSKKYKGIIKELSGKQALIQGAAWAKRQDISARSTITIEPSLGLDQLGIPTDMAYKMFKPFIIQDLKTQGLKATTALKEYQDKTNLAYNSLNTVIQNRPVFFNRAPSLHKHAVQAFWPQLVTGKAIQTNPLITKGYNLDYDGDSEINSVLMFLNNNYLQQLSKLNTNLVLDIQEKIPYIKGEIKINQIKNIMSRYNVKTGLKQDGKYYLVNLEDFPYDKNKLIGTKDHIDFYEVPDGVEIFAYDEKKQEVSLQKVSGWSVHKDREIYTVTLQNKQQIISDDDPRAVYGINPGTLEFVRNRPKDSIGMLVPTVRSLTKGLKIKQLDHFTEGIADSKRLKPTIELNDKTGYILGALIGDGWFDAVKDKYRCVWLSGIEKPIQKQLEEFLTEIFKEAPHVGHQIMKTSYGRSEKLCVSSSDFAKWTAPLIGKGANNKHLPPFWFTANRSFKLGLLSGLLDTNGCVCISHSKVTPQIAYSFCSNSIRLVQEIQHLLLTLGVKSRISFSKKTQTDNDSWILSASAADMKLLRDDLITVHERNRTAMYTDKAYPNMDSSAATKADLVPIDSATTALYLKRIGAKRNDLKDLKALYVTVCNTKKRGYITRHAANRLLKKYPEIIPTTGWKQIVKNTSVSWQPVISFENTGKKETGYDLTVPGYETFMSVDGIILSNTMSIMTPINSLAVEEAKGMFPSKILFKHGDNSLVPSLSQDYLYGIHELSQIKDVSAKSFESVAAAKKAGLPWTTQFKLKGKNITIGQHYLNDKLPTPLKDFTRLLNKKVVNDLLTKVGKEYPGYFVDLINSWKDLGSFYAYKVGNTISLNDFANSKSYRDVLLAQEMPAINKLTGATRITALNKLTQDVEKAQNKAFKGKNNMYKMLEAGSFSKPDSVRQILSMPGVLNDIYGKPISIPVIKSYGEGLDAASYFTSLYAVRSGTVDRSVNTQDTGALNKALLNVTRRLLITTEDCATQKGIELPVDDKNVLDRFILETIPGLIKRNQLIDSETLLKLKLKGITSIKVRSPLTCAAVDGICQLCYGLLPNGSLAPLGTNVGILDSQALTEAFTQNVMRTFHCWHPGSTLMTEGGELRTIADIVNSNYQGKVLDKNNVFVQVTKAWKHKITAPVVFVKTKNGRSLMLQDNHPLPVITNTYICKYCGGRLKSKSKQCADCARRSPKAVPNTNLTNCTIKEVKDIHSKKESLIYQNFPSNFGTKRWDWEFSPYMLGAYISEGCVNRRGDKLLGITWSQEPNTEIHKKYVTSLNKPISNNKNIRLYNSKLAARVAQECGDYSNSKKLPYNILKYSKDTAYQILAGIIDGNGTISRYPENGRASGNDIVILDTTSYALANQLVILGQALGISTNMFQATFRTISNYQPLRVTFKITKQQLRIFKKISFKIQNIKTGKLVSYVDKATIKSIQPTNYMYDEVFDIETKSSTLVINGIFVHNSGGSALGGGGVTEGFPRMTQLLKVPEKLSYKATLSTVKGHVVAIQKNQTGGYNIKIGGYGSENDKSFVVPPGRTPIVALGDKVEPGDPLSDGVIKPQELGELKTHLDAQNYLVDEASKLMGGSFFRKTFETVIRGISDNAIVTSAPDKSGFLRGDRTTISYLDKLNKDRKKEKMEPIEYNSYFKSIDTLNTDSNDWLTKITSNRIKAALMTGAAKGQYANLKGRDPIPAYIYGESFGKQIMPDKGEFY